MTDDVILYRLPEHAETELKLLIAEGAPVGYAAEGAARIAIAEELRMFVAELEATREQWRAEDDRTIRSSGLGYAIDALRARAKYLHPEGEQS